MSYGNFGEHSVDQVRSRPAHSSGIAGRARASPLARKRDQEFFRTEPASRSKKAKSVDTALQEGTEFLLDVRGKTSLVLHAGFGEEGFQMLGHEQVENGLGGPMLGVFGRTGASWHAHIRARGVPSEVGPISSLLGVAAVLVGDGSPNAPPSAIPGRAGRARSRA